MIFGEWSLITILNKIEIIETKKSYNYNQKQRINSKPALQTGNENLHEYPCKLQLHCSFCNPKRVIETLEKRAESREPVDWIFHGKYMGQFVINNIEESVTNQVKGNIIYAEVIFNMLEFPVETEFLQQITGDIDIKDTYSESSNKFKDFAEKIKDSVKENIKETVAASVVSDNLPDAAKEIFESVKNGVLNDIAEDNILNIYSRINRYTDIIKGTDTLHINDIIELVDVVENIPKNILTTCLRGASG